ncbi:MAG: outer membrane beta-barrel protein [Thermoanaerobaculales bacterium]
MRLKNLLPIMALGALILAPAAANAQFTKSWKDWYGHVAGGYSFVRGDAAGVIKDGWNVNGGATYYPDDWLIGISLGLDFESHDLKREILDAFEASGGDVNIAALTLGLSWSPKLDGSIGFYVNGGIGGYYVKGKLKEPGVVCGPVCPPWSWWCSPGCLPGTIITDSTSSTDFGLNLAAAITFEVGEGSMIYVEVKYHRIDSAVTTTYIPISVGYRW